MKVRKKPVEVEAIQFTGDNHSEVYAFMGHYLYGGVDTLMIPTLEGNMMASAGDWIIRGVQGEIYPCKPHIFDATYDIIGDESQGLDVSETDQGSGVQTP